MTAKADLPVMTDIASTADLLALALQSGCSIVTALRSVSGLIREDLGHHLKTVAAALEWGVDPALAWAKVPEAWDPVAQAIRLAHAAGVPPAGLLERAAADIRRTEEERLEAAAARLSVQVVLPLGLCFLPAFVVVAVVPFVIALAGSVLEGW